MADTPDEDEIYLEYTRVGPYLKVSAICAKTGTEVFAAGPATGCRETLTRAAIGKLKQALRRNAQGGGWTV
ncbi:MAG TPA: hypothetical protein VD860_09805 [Azospirillum sp.]|nr:hypothetical protein [Azospirillum sp.]